MSIGRYYIAFDIAGYVLHFVFFSPGSICWGKFGMSRSWYNGWIADLSFGCGCISCCEGGHP